MPKRETVFASAILAALVPAMVLSVGLHHAQGAANNCLAKPNAAPPQGSHWYYRVDQAGNRRCWFLASEGATPRQALSPKPAPNPPPKRASQPKATATAQPVAREMDRAATYAMLSPALPTSADVVDGERASASNGAAGGLVAMHPEDDMPLIGPVLSAAELAAVEWPPGLAARLGPMLAYVAAALALAMIVRKVFRLFAVRRLRRRRMALREQWNQELRATCRGEPVSPAFADMVAAPGPAQHRRKLVAVPRIAEIARPPADEWDPDHDIEALDAEESLQQFLPRWRRVAA